MSGAFIVIKLPHTNQFFSGPYLRRILSIEEVKYCYLLILEDFLEEHHRVLESRLSAVSREITDNRACAREELESLYRKIVSYVLLRSGLGSPTDIKIVREATGKRGMNPYAHCTYVYSLRMCVCASVWAEACAHMCACVVEGRD